jgi:hypothetical protein
MTDTLGPASDQSTTARPARSNVRGTTDTWFKDCSGPDIEDGTELPADWLNDVLAQLRTAFSSSGITRNNADDMLWRAIQSIGIRYTVATGAANAYVATFNPPIAAYGAGGLFIAVRIPAANTLGSVINCDALGNKSIIRTDGTALQSGDLPLNGIALLAFDAGSA